MTIDVKVITRAKMRKIQYINDLSYKIWTTKPAENGRANRDVVDMLADYFDLPKSDFTIIQGATSSKKVIFIA